MPLELLTVELRRLPVIASVYSWAFCSEGCAVACCVFLSGNATKNLVPLPIDFQKMILVKTLFKIAFYLGDAPRYFSGILYLRGHLDFTAVGLDNLKTDGQAQARALAYGLGGEKRVENFRQRIFGDAFAGVLYRDIGIIALGVSLDVKRPLALDGLGRVGEQIQQHLVDLGRRTLD